MVATLIESDGKKIVRTPWGDIVATEQKDALHICEIINQAYIFGMDTRSMEIRDLLGAAKDDMLRRS